MAKTERRKECLAVAFLLADANALREKLKLREGLIDDLRAANANLVSLDQHDRDAGRHFARDKGMKRPGPNGIACPKCGAELWDTSPSMEITTAPGRKEVACQACGWKGTRICT